MERREQLASAGLAGLAGLHVCLGRRITVAAA